MKQLLILSGKGGTGKTTVASAFIHILQTKAYADCDVEAPNLHITNKISGKEIKENYMGMPKAEIEKEKCINCNQCIENCRFLAIHMEDKPVVNPFLCEGCNVCAYICPTEAIHLKEYIGGETMVVKTQPYFSSAVLKMGVGASGRLVSEVKKNLRNVLPDEFKKNNENLVIIDGSPGIGCPVIASLSGVDMVLLVTEPTLSGMSDLKRILDTAVHFKVKTAVCINKYTISEEISSEICAFCEANKIAMVGKIPYDKTASIAINQGKSIMEYQTPAAKAMQKICVETIKLIGSKTEEEK